MRVPFYQSAYDDEDFAALRDVLRGGWLTAGPRVAELEQRFSDWKGGRPAIAVNSCTAGLFLAMQALGVGSGMRVALSPLAFVSAAHVVLQCGAEPVFVDVEPENLCINPEKVAEIAREIDAVIAVHWGGRPARMDALAEVASAQKLLVIEDCAHAAEAEVAGLPVGVWGDAAAFSFYPTKNISSAEGGMIVCKDEIVAAKCRSLRLHGFDLDAYARESGGGFRQYDVSACGYKHNMNELQAALALRSLDCVEANLARRASIAARYDDAFAPLDSCNVLPEAPGSRCAHHLYPLFLNPETLRVDKAAVMDAIIARGVQLSVHFRPIPAFSYYRALKPEGWGRFPIAEDAYARMFSLPLYPAMTDEAVDYVIAVVTDVLREYRR